MRDFTPTGSALTSRSATHAFPALGATRVMSMPMVVDLPAPLVPTRPKNSPWWTVRSRPSTATRSPCARGYTLRRPSVRMAAGAWAVSAAGARGGAGAGVGFMWVLQGADEASVGRRTGSYGVEVWPGRPVPPRRVSSADIWPMSSLLHGGAAKISAAICSAVASMSVSRARPVSVSAA